MSPKPDPVARMLCSFYYWRKRDLTVWDGVTANLRSAGGHLEIFADSGAFSAFSLRGTGGAVKREDYAAWLKHWRSRLTIMANLDVIGDPKGTAQNQLWFEEQGLPVLPVWHATSRETELVAMCRDYDYIALGGMASVKSASNRQAAIGRAARAVLIAREAGTVLHGFGRSAPPELSAVPYYSVDATSWMQGSRFGRLQVFTGQQVKSLTIQQAARQPQLLRSHGANPQGLRHPLYGNLGRKAGIQRNYSEYRRENDESTFVAAVAWKRYEAWLRRRHHVHPPSGHKSTGTCIWFADDNLWHQQQMIRAVTWLAERN